MSSLIEEYRKRHSIDCIWPMNEGSLFFERAGKPTVVTITSSFTRGHTVCPACPLNAESIVLEVFKVHSYPRCLLRMTHTHMPPDADLLHYIRNHLPQGEEYVPYISKGERDQE